MRCKRHSGLSLVGCRAMTSCTDSSAVPPPRPGCASVRGWWATWRSGTIASCCTPRLHHRVRLDGAVDANVDLIEHASRRHPCGGTHAPSRRRRRAGVPRAVLDVWGCRRGLAHRALRLGTRRKGCVRISDVQPQATALLAPSMSTSTSSPCSLPPPQSSRVAARAQH